MLVEHKDTAFEGLDKTATIKSILDALDSAGPEQCKYSPKANEWAGHVVADAMDWKIGTPVTRKSNDRHKKAYRKVLDILNRMEAEEYVKKDVRKAKRDNRNTRSTPFYTIIKRPR